MKLRKHKYKVKDNAEPIRGLIKPGYSGLSKLEYQLRSYRFHKITIGFTRFKEIAEGITKPWVK